MPDKDETDELRRTQLERELAERTQAQTAAGEEETAQHARRAEKARYLREKLEERAAVEQDLD